MRVIKPPESFDAAPRPWVFLAGSIEGGTAEDWQTEATRLFEAAGFQGTVLNPRRDDWDPSWEEKIENTSFRDQVEWELGGQESADCIFMYFDPATRSPVTLLELGLAASRCRLVVCCPDGFWKKGSVDIVCRKYGITEVAELRDFVRYLPSANPGDKRRIERVR